MDLSCHMKYLLHISLFFLVVFSFNSYAYVLYEVGMYIYPVVAADVNNDNFDDLLISGGELFDNIAILINKGDGTFVLVPACRAKGNVYLCNYRCTTR